MEKIINRDNLRSFAYVNDHICQKPIRGIVVYFQGLGWSQMLHEDPPEGVKLAGEGILYVVPYNRPWAWLNQQAVDYTDEILDVLFRAYGLPENTPIVSSGKSMGGLSSILYCKLAKRTPVACVANCPVCDLLYHSTERADLPRTLYSAFYHEPGTLEEVLASHSPLHQIRSLPRIPYHIFHCEEDLSVNIHHHSETFVAAMEQLGHRVTYHTVPGKGHCDLSEEMKLRFEDFCINEIKG